MSHLPFFRSFSGEGNVGLYFFIITFTLCNVRAGGGKPGLVRGVDKRGGGKPQKRASAAEEVAFTV